MENAKKTINLFLKNKYNSVNELRFFIILNVAFLWTER